MEVREPSAKYLAGVAFKQTVVGSIPSDWEVVQTCEACTKIQDGTHFSPKLGGSDYLYVTSKNVRFGYLDLKDVDRIDANQHRDIYRRCDVKKGDLLLTKDGANTGNAALNTLSEEFSLLSSVAFLRFIPGRHEAAYFLQQILSSNTQKQILDAMSGNAITRLTLDKIRKLSIPTPPTLAEQQAIATALSDADALIESLELLLAKKRQIKQGAMQELLTAQRRLPGFVGEWKSGCVGDVIAGLLTGVSVNSTEQDSFSEVPSVLKTSALSSGKFRPAESKPIVNADLHRARCQPRRDTLLISRMNTPDLVGEVAYVEQDYDWLYLPDRIWMAKPRSSEIVCVRWLNYVLCSPEYKARIGDAATGTSGSMKNIAKSAFLGLPIQYPEVMEQTAIAQLLSDMDADIAAVETRLTKARAIKQGMMQELLTGRIRLV